MAAGKMRPADTPHVITATGSDSLGKDWDSTDNSPVGRWVSVDRGSGPADLTGHAMGEFEDGPGRWKQT